MPRDSDPISDELPTEDGDASAPTRRVVGPDDHTRVVSPGAAEVECAERFGDYEILRELGRGGQGIVYLAEDGRLGRRVALKVLTRVGPGSEKLLLRFQREAAVTARLDHAGICGVYESGTRDGIPFIAMRYVDGESLAARIVRARALDAPVFEEDTETATGGPPRERDPVLRTVAVFEDVARAIHAAHEAGVIHRDLKPANIMIDRDGRPVVLDFGLARQDDEEAPTITRSGEVFGTPAYMAPEQFRAGEAQIDHRADVYALGVSLYETLTLRRPFGGPTWERIALAVRDEEALPPRRLDPAISRDLDVVVRVAMEKDVERRYATALDLADDLRRVRERVPIRARPASLPTRLWRMCQRHPGVAGSLTAFVLALAIGLAASLYFLGQARRAEETARRESEARAVALAEKTRVLNSYEQLSDVRRARLLLDEAETLWPRRAAVVPAMDAWSGRAETVLSRRGDHEAALAELRARGREEGGAWRFEDETDSWRHGVLVRVLEALDGVERAMADVAGRREFAGTVETLSVRRADAAAAWTACLEDLEGDERFDDVDLEPQLGLVPLGKDRDSGLWEFWHVGTGEPPTWVAEGSDLTGRVSIDERSAMVLVLIPGGAFMMGAQADDPAAPHHHPRAEPAEAPVHRVKLAPFFIGKYEVTQAQWRYLTGANPSLHRAGVDRGDQVLTGLNPVEKVSWDEADLWLRRIELELPTEAQWERAARGGTRTAYWSGDAVESLDGCVNLADRHAHRYAPNWAWTDEIDDGFTVHSPVGSYRANPFGLHDVLGNVFEWCLDRSAEYSVAPREGDGLRDALTEIRAIRGGAFSNEPSVLRCSFRNGLLPSTRNDVVGIRVARSLR